MASRRLPALVQSAPVAGPPDQWEQWRRRGGARVAAPAGRLCARAAQGAEGWPGLRGALRVRPAPARSEAPGRSPAPARGRRAPRDRRTPVWGGGRSAAPPTTALQVSSGREPGSGSGRHPGCGPGKGRNRGLGRGQCRGSRPAPLHPHRAAVREIPDRRGRVPLCAAWGPARPAVRLAPRTPPVAAQPEPCPPYSTGRLRPAPRSHGNFTSAERIRGWGTFLGRLASGKHPHRGDGECPGAGAAPAAQRTREGMLPGDPARSPNLAPHPRLPCAPLVGPQTTGVSRVPFGTRTRLAVILSTQQEIPSLLLLILNN